MNTANLSVMLLCFAATVSAADPVTLEVASWDGTEKHIGANKGKIVVLDVWSSSCIPCVKELPHLAKLQQQFPKDVAGISLNCNFIGIGRPEEEQAAVLKFLTAKEIRCLNLLSSIPDDELFKKLAVASIPVVRVYGRDGKLLKQFDNDSNEYGDDGFSYEKHVAPFVAKLVKGE